jgi:hypothetical protein
VWTERNRAQVESAGSPPVANNGRRGMGARSARLAGASALAGLAIGAPAPKQAHAQSGSCTAIICAPSLVFESALNRSHLFGGPEVRSLADGSVSHLPSQSSLELFFVVAAPIRVPRTSLFLSLQWLPNASAAANPFTEYTASELGTGAVRANMPSATFGVSVDAITSAMARGWVTLAPYLGDLYSTAARPEDESAYTHKLDAGLNAGVALMNWLSPHVWLRNVKGFMILDDVLIGLPRAGDEVPKGERVFLTDARPAALIAGLSVPLAPLDPHT